MKPQLDNMSIEAKGIILAHIVFPRGWSPLSFIVSVIKEEIMKIGRFDIFRSLSLLFRIVTCTLLVGCATMFAPDTDKVTIKTNPEGASVYSGTNLLGKTPLTYSFERETFEKKTLIIRMQGYKNHELLLAKVLEKKALFNLAFITTTFGVTSWGIDAGTGNMIKYSPDSYLIDLEKEGKSSSRKDSARLQRFRFVAMNQERLMKEIAARDGEYLKTYFESRTFDSNVYNYQLFLVRISSRAPLLLSSDDPAVFFNNLEGT